MTRHSILLNGAHIVVPRPADSVRQLAGRELQRFLYLLTGVESVVGDAAQRRGVTVTIGIKSPVQLGVANPEEALGRDGFTIRTQNLARGTAVHLAAVSSRGLLNGVYTLLEDLGVGFHLGGETLPDRKVRAILPVDYQRTGKPSFAVRGQLIHDNTLVGITGWGEADYRAYFSQMARLRCNTVVLMCYGDEAAEVWHEEDGRLLNARPVMSSLTKPWRAVESLRTSQFHFGTGDFFDEEVFGHPALAVTRDPVAQRREITGALARAIRAAKAGGLDIATGFVAPVGDVNRPADPTDRRVREAFQRRIRCFLERNPDLKYFLLSNYEGGGCSGTRPPADHSAGQRLFKSQKPLFAYLGNTRRVWEAIRFGRFAQLAWEVLQRDAPRVKLVINGWGGDRWMLFADYALGYDKVLPPDVIFTCLENIESTLSNTVSAAWGELPAARQRWAVPWIENDHSDFWTPQPNVAGLRELAGDALRKGCQGLAVMAWRTRDFEEEIGFAARFAWEPTLTPERFYHRMARDTFGPAHAKRMAARFLALQRLGRRWTGVKGTAEIADMTFTGAKPHLPFELGSAAARFLLPFARDAARKLAEPYDDDQDLGNLADELLKTKEAPEPGTTTRVSSSQLGVAEFNRILRILTALARERNAERVRRGLMETMEIVFGVRDQIIRRGLTPAQFCAMDLYWLHAHQLAYFAGSHAKLAALDRIAAEVRTVRQKLAARRQVGRLERCDYLLATLDFSRHYDRVAMLLADGEAIEVAIRRGQRLLKKGRTGAARTVAAAAYWKLIAAGMHDAVLALTRKLSTQCEWGILATVNIKPIPKYFEFVGKLEALMPAAPPRQVHAQLRGNEVHLWWDAAKKPEGGYLVYRREAGGAARTICLTRPPLSPDLTVFMDRPTPGRRYAYWVTALAKDGWESPPSHPVAIETGRLAEGPRLVVRRPVDIFSKDEPIEIRAIACSDSPVQHVTLHHRLGLAGGWQQIPMRRRFRNSYHHVLPPTDGAESFLEYYLEAVDESGRRTYWPATAPGGRRWTASIIRQTKDSQRRG